MWRRTLTTRTIKKLLISDTRASRGRLGSWLERGSIISYSARDLILPAQRCAFTAAHHSAHFSWSQWRAWMNTVEYPPVFFSTWSRTLFPSRVNGVNPSRVWYQCAAFFKYQFLSWFEMFERWTYCRNVTHVFELQEGIHLQDRIRGNGPG